MVPAELKERMWRAYGDLPHGPEGNCLRMSKEYIDAVKAAEAAIKERIFDGQILPSL